ncbi:MAG: ParB/RepB/Spo0J family partition protein [Gemmatimonadota bacterium]
MSAPRRLGRGLGALLGEDYLSGPTDAAEIRTLPLGRIVANPLQPRREFRAEELGDLTRSIRENGLLQPLVVRPDPEAPAGARFQLVAGERRLRAVSQLAWTEVPVVVREVDDRTLLVLALVENIQREALNPLEEAEGFQLLVDEFGLTQGEVAEAVGRSRPAVANSLRLLRLPPSVRRLLEEGALSMGHARALLAIEDPGRLVEMGRRAATEGWSVREIEDRVRAEPRNGGGGRASKGRGGSDASMDPVARALQEALQEALGTRVRLKVGGKGAGIIEVPYGSEADFERVFELMTGRDPSEVVS